jgi:hypothetical protein
MSAPHRQIPASSRVRSAPRWAEPCPCHTESDTEAIAALRRTMVAAAAAVKAWKLAGFIGLGHRCPDYATGAVTPTAQIQTA